MTNEEKVQHWVNLADYDMESAEVMLQAKRYLYVGFMCHQAVEKIFKAYFMKIKDKTPPHTHDLVGLAQKTGLFDLMAQQQKDYIRMLNPMNIETRYPEYKNKLAKMLTAEVSQNILTKAKEIVQWTKQMIY